MRTVRVTSILVLVGLLGALATACSKGEELATPKPGFCEAAARYDKRVERNAKLPEQITILEKLERNAPKDIAADATLFLTSMRKLEAGDTSVIDNAKVAQAVENVNRRAINGCEFFKKEPGSGL
jgi:hypothetical protein